MRSITAAGILIALLPTTVEAAPLTYACRYTPDPFLSEFAKVDQIVVDREARTIELRVANTMGTSNEVNFVFRDLGTPMDSVNWNVAGTEDRVSGTRFGMPFIFAGMGPLFGLAFADGLPFVYHEWTCTR
jgi:hypothetical protein